MAPLTAQELKEQQAIVDGFAFGPTPALNPANLNTQDKIGNPQVAGASTQTYYPQTVFTPKLELSLFDMSSTLANNFVILDSLFPTGGTITAPFIPILQGRLDALNTTTTHSLSYTATVTTMFTTSVFMESEGDGQVTDTVLGTLTFTEDDPADTHSYICVLHGGAGENIVMETYPVLVEAGTVITFATTFGAGVMTYDISVRLVQMP